DQHRDDLHLADPDLLRDPEGRRRAGAPRRARALRAGGIVRVAVIGATGAVGREMLRILERRGFPVDELVPLASARRVGLPVTFRGREHRIRELTVDACDGVDVAFVSIGATASRAFLPDIAANGTVCIDNSSAFRMNPDVPLVVPDVNPEALHGWPRPGI